MRESIHGGGGACRAAAGWLIAAAVFATMPLGSSSGQEREADGASPKSALKRIEVVSTLDGQRQPVLFDAPQQAADRPTPMLVFLHSWSSDYRQDNSAWHAEAVRRGWIYLHPDFRGPNRSPQACGSKFARGDILDAMDVMMARLQVDPERVYLAGSSGGGHMAMLMAGHHPNRFSAVSAWVGISDLASWYDFHVVDGVPQRYANMIVDSLGGPPGRSRRRDAEYRDRSPLFHLSRAVGVPLDLNAGVNDGHTGSVPIRHTLDAFNVIARRNGDTPICEPEIRQLSNDLRLKSPLPSDLAIDPSLGREIRLRRRSGVARVTIFDGGHEGLAGPACEWLSQQRRATAATD